MALYLRDRDASFVRRVNREFISKIVGQEVGYYKIDLESTVVDIYGDTKKKFYYNPILVSCLIGRQAQTASEMPYGTDNNQPIDFRFLRDDLVDIQLVPEKGDIVMWEESYYEVDNVIDNELLSGKNPEYAISEDMDKFGNSLSIICQAHLTRVNNTNISVSR